MFILSKQLFVDLKKRVKLYIPDQSVPLILEQTVPVFRTKQNR